MAVLLLEIKQAVEQAKSSNRTNLLPDQIARFEARYEDPITLGLQAKSPPELNPTQPRNEGGSNKARRRILLDRLSKTNKVC